MRTDFIYNRDPGDENDYSYKKYKDLTWWGLMEEFEVITRKKNENISDNSGLQRRKDDSKGN